MESNQKELNLKELEKVNGGHVLPIKPDEDDEKNEEAVKAIEEEGEKPKVTSFAGYTEDQLRQMYQKGEISRQDYEKQVKLKEQLKEEASGDTGEVNKMMKGVLGLSNEGEKDETELKALFSEDSSDKIPTAERIAFMDAVENYYVNRTAGLLRVICLLALICIPAAFFFFCTKRAGPKTGSFRILM